MFDYLKKVLELVRPYRFRFMLGLLCGFFSGALAFTLPVSLTLAVSTIFHEKKDESLTFTSGDIHNLPAFAGKLSRKSDPASAFLAERLDPVTQEVLARYLSSKSNAPTLDLLLVHSLNRLVLHESLAEESAFRTISSTPKFSELLAQKPQGTNLFRLNHLLLAEAFPEELAKSLSKTSKKMDFLPSTARKALDGIGSWVRPGGNPSTARKLFVVALIPGAMLVRGLLGYLNIYMLSWVGIRAANDLKVRLFSHLMQLPLGFFSKTSTGLLMAQIENAMGVNNTINGAFATIIREPISIVVLVVTLVAMQPFLSLATLIVFPICLVPVMVYGRKLKKSHSGIYSKFASANDVLHESFTGVRVIKAYNLETQVVDQFRRVTQAVTGFFMRSVRASEVPGPLIEFIGALGVSLIFAYFAFLAPGQAPVGDLLAFFIAVFGLYAPVKNLSRLQSQLTQARAGVEPVYQLLAVQTSLPEPAQPKELKARGAPIRFENVRFSYGEKVVLHDINLTIQPGQKVALVGRTGSGKTSLANLLLRFYDPQKGAVLIGDTDIRAVSSRDLRANIAVVTQDTILFNDTIRNNIALGRPGATNAEIEAAAEHAYAHGFITKEKNLGYDTPVGEKGVNVSGGQRQRIAIARAILRNAPILILDEATNALDAEAEKIVQEALDELMKGRTTICIAHRLSTIQGADVIVVLDNGRIVETGTHAELLRTGGIYSKLHELSFESVPA